MSGTYPSTPGPAAYELRSIQPTMVSMAHSMKRQVRTRGGQRWALQFSYAKRLTDMRALWAFLVAQRGQYDTFTVRIPGYRPRGALGGSPLVNGAFAPGVRSVNIDGVSNVTGWGKAGDLFKFANHAKVYMLTADVDTAGGAGVLAFEPGLYTTPADNSAVTFTSVPFTMALAADELSYGLQAGSLAAFSVDLIEVP